MSINGYHAKGYVVYAPAFMHIDIHTVSSSYIVLMLMNEQLKVNCLVRSHLNSMH